MTYTALRSTNLKSLLEELQSITDKYDNIDWSELPVFGGSEPSTTEEVWSWDEDNVLVGTCADDLEIISRREFEESERAYRAAFKRRFPRHG
jgi:hypothetical protein